jgi:DNA-binding MarR family transcriptional regulator
MKIEKFSEEQESFYFGKIRLLISNDKNIDDSTFRFATLFQTLHFIEQEPKGLTYSQRELGKKFGITQKQVGIHLKRLETFGYIKIEPFEKRRMLYIPTEKLLGFKKTDTNIEREDLRKITSSDDDQSTKGTNLEGSNDPNSPKYTLYPIHCESKTCRPKYAELPKLPKWSDIKEKVCDKLRKFKGCLAFEYSFKTYYTKHPIPLSNVLNIVETFANVKNTGEFKKSPEAYLAQAFKNQEEQYRLEYSRKIEEIENKDKLKASTHAKNINSAVQEFNNLAYNLNTGKMVIDADIPKTLLSLWEDTDRVTIDRDGYVKRLPNVLFFTKPGEPNIYSTSTVNIKALERQGIEIPGLEKAMETVV